MCGVRDGVRESGVAAVIEESPVGAIQSPLGRSGELC
jgi:hypothetical protein